MDLGLGGRAILITGASGGIGLATARAVAREGARVAIAARSEDRLAAACAELLALGAPDALAVPADLAVPGEPERAVAAAAERFGGLDALVCNVGYAEARRLDDLTDADWEASFQVNLMTHVRAVRAALPLLRASDQARIAMVASTAGKRPSTGMPDYSVMKAALLSFSRLVADLEAKNGVLVNAICPGPTATDAWLAAGGLADQTKGAGTREEALAKAGAGRPIGRLAEPEEIADVIALLVSARSSYVTGAAWGVDGGTVPVII
jgi:3-oxoacyl-[acyl-carrier protein] reductase